MHYTFSRLTRFNLPSRRAHAHLGWQRVGSAVFLQAWSAELMLASIFPYIGLAIGSGRRIALTLSPGVLQASQADSVQPIAGAGSRIHSPADPTRRLAP